MNYLLDLSITKEPAMINLTPEALEGLAEQLNGGMLFLNVAGNIISRNLVVAIYPETLPEGKEANVIIGTSRGEIAAYIENFDAKEVMQQTQTNQFILVGGALVSRNTLNTVMPLQNVKLAE